MTETMKIAVIFVVASTGAVLFLMGAAIFTDVLAAYRRQRLYELHRRDK